jgi:hypothetical protein
MTDKKFTEEYVKVGDLQVDRVVQRSTIDQRKVETLKKRWNEGAVGYIVVSRRKDRSMIIIDGQHRWAAYKELTDNQGEMLAQVFEGLTLGDEAQLFLDTNYGNQPTLLDKFRVRTVAGDEVALDITRILRPFGWDVVNSNNPGSVKAVGALERIYKVAKASHIEPNILESTFRVITHAWGLDVDGVHAVILVGVSAIIEENDAGLSLEKLEKVMGKYPSGPYGLHVDATQLAALRRTSVGMGVAEQIVEYYNKQQGKKLPIWRRRK